MTQPETMCEPIVIGLLSLFLCEDAAARFAP